MCGVYRIAFIEYILAGNTSLHNTNLFSLNDYKKNDKIIYKYLKVVKDLMFKKMSRLPILAKSKYFNPTHSPKRDFFAPNLKISLSGVKI